VSRAQQSSITNFFLSINASKSLTTCPPGWGDTGQNPIGVDFLVEGGTKGLILSDTKMIYNGYGCGRNNRLCTCELDNNGDLVMRGQNSRWSFTGLRFSCQFQVEQQSCSIRLVIPRNGRSSLTCDCGGGYSISNCNIPTPGSRYNKCDMAISPSF